MPGSDGPGGQVTSRHGFPAILAQLVLSQAGWIHSPIAWGESGRRIGNDKFFSAYGPA